MRPLASLVIITSQLPIEHWHAWIGDATIADAILDRVMQKNHRFNFMGESLRAIAKTAASATQGADRRLPEYDRQKSEIHAARVTLARPG